MSGKFLGQEGRNSSWVDELKAESVQDTLSQISDATVEDLNPVGASDVKERMRKLFESQRYTDVTFYPKNNRELSIQAHRAVLAIASPLFAKMLFGDNTKDTAGMKLEVQISNIPFDAFTNIVRYLYTDEVSFENETLVQGILDGAKQFEIHSLVMKCKRYFENMVLTEENVCSKLHLSLTNKLEVLKERCIEFIEKNTLPVIQSSGFQRLNSSAVCAICKLQSLNIRSEVELLEAVMQWLHAQPQANRKSLLEPLLRCIRFLNFSVDEMGDTLKKYPDLMRSDDGLKIILFLYNPPKKPDFSALPSWCNKNLNNRCFYKENVSAPLIGLNVEDPQGELVGKVVFSLKPDPGQGFVSQLTSMLQMRCISGFHQIKAITLTFDKLMSPRSRIGNLSINVHVHPCNFTLNENVQIANSETVRIEFKKAVKTRRGDSVDIVAEAKDIEFYRFLQFEETTPMPLNPHFSCCVTSRPKQGRLFFISELEYSPQDRVFGHKQDRMFGNRPRSRSKEQPQERTPFSPSRKKISIR